MKKNDIFIILIFSLLGILNAFAGPRVGNGGGAWVCEKEDVVSWIEIVDLFEAKNEFGLALIDFQKSDYKEIIKHMKRRLDQTNYYYSNNFDVHLHNIERSQQSINNIDLVTIDDVHARVTPSPESCLGGDISYIQVINFTNDGRILIDDKYWSLLRPRDKAALTFHEAFYSLFREIYEDTDSIRARRIVGLLFSDISTSELEKRLKDEVFFSNSPHLRPFDVEILPFILTNTAVQKYITRTLDEYCVNKLDGLCSDEIYFKQVSISPLGGDVKIPDVDHILITSPYQFKYQLRGQDIFCIFDITVLQERRRGAFSKRIYNLESSCFEENR